MNFLGDGLADLIPCWVQLPAASRATGGLLASDEVGSAARARKLNQSGNRSEFTRHTLVNSGLAAGCCSVLNGHRRQSLVGFNSVQFSLSKKGLSHAQESLE